MNVKLTTKVGLVPVIEIDWCDVHNASDALTTIANVLKNHKEVASEPHYDVKPIYVDDKTLEKVAKLLFTMTHEKAVDEDDNIIFTPIVENNDVDIYKYI